MKENIYGAPTPESQGESGQQPYQQPYHQPYQSQPPVPPQPPIPGAEPGPAPESEPEPEHEPSQRGGRRVLPVVLAGLLGGVLGAGALTAALLATGVVGPTHTQLSSGTTQQVTIDPSDEDTTVANAVAAKALPSVVAVYCTYDNGSGMGSGVVYDTDGNVITNYHVIEGATAITVTINGKSYNAELVGTDASSDLAVIKVDLGGDTVTPMEIGSSSNLQVGDWVMSVGAPFGLENSVSAGIVSALYRNTLMENTSGNTLYTNLIQVDASINPGNSGGALVDSQGKLVGICTLYSSDTESFAGIGFAIPGDYATEVADKIIAGETVTHAYIGLSMATVNARNAEANNLSVNYGAYVAEVTADSPADKAGIQVGDVVVGIGGTEITSSDGAILAVRSHSIGETVTVTVVRGTQELELEVTLGSDEALQAQQQEQQQEQQQNGGTSDEGITFEDLQRWYEEFRQEQQNQNQNQNQNQDLFGRGY